MPAPQNDSPELLGHGFDPVAFDKAVEVLDEICDCKAKNKHRGVVEVILSTYITSSSYTTREN